MPRRLLSGEGIAGVGIAAPGPLDPARGTLVEPPNLPRSFAGAALAGPIGAALALPAALERDTHVAALAEWEFGAARGLTDFLYVTVSTGIGGAIVSGGRLLGGPDGVAGELGHLLVEIDGPPCGCGGRGHLEAIASGSGIARAAGSSIAAGAAAGLGALAARRGRGLDARDVADAEDAGDADAARIMERARRAFAESCVALVNVFNPQRIVVGGSVARNQGERWLAPARERVAAIAFSVPRARVEIVPAELGDDVGLVGALPLLRRRAAGAGGLIGLRARKTGPAGRQGPLAIALGPDSAADLEDLATADRASALKRGLAVLHRDLLGIHDFDLLLVLDAIRFGHGAGSSSSAWRHGNPRPVSADHVFVHRDGRQRSVPANCF